MKRIIAFAAAIFMLFSFASCSSQPKPGEVEPNPVEKAQKQIISSFGITQKDSRIVAYQGTNDYVKYVVVYYENGIRTDEVTHMFYTNDVAFEAAKEEMSENPHITEIADEKRYISYWSGLSAYGEYEKDLEIIKSEYTLK